ncbi:dihydroxyacetone kinase subunit DhaK [Testudinibacter aquarius]|uniref:phosphoenolpyruvate--glycerone phosphotransferase n=1 Tax=Testudinibacter aquarius TaxID=1524974 RepID=A0A4R3Y7U0_9PAST|nr:dihydroxyacetone kinase subunit DhaK [Testudinibacter aquarius]KAE9525514.1 dihydroxyacetone kinase [Testudinibacter aquarius]TCV87910.1 dihydroxyacetone kinase DhaK subunit [Testudinibacter aquarius]TNG87043.1 dihydroxyacetone kinase subunit DhaK [Testudinibacter aquarius]
MKKMINQAENIVSEMLLGMLKAYPNMLQQVADLPIIVRKQKKQQKVGLVSGGGSGHEPAHAGFVGYGMLDAAVAGEVFTSPSADKVYEAIKAVDSGKGVLLVIKNYSGDVMNFEMAAEMAAMEGITVSKIIVDDDIAVENSTYTVGRRGIAGTVWVHKMVGAAAESGYSLEALEQFGNKVIANTKSIGMALKPCLVPTTGKLSFELADDEVEIGLGIHGEPGTHREKIQSADQHVDHLLEKLLAESNLSAEDEVAVLVNGLGETTLIELFIINNRVADVLQSKNIRVVDTLVGNYMTSLDMGGFSITLSKLDSEMKQMLQAKADTVAFKRG